MVFKISFLFVLLVFSAFFSSSETAFTSLSAIQLKSMKSRRKKLVMKMTSRPDLLLTTILLGNNLVNIAASAVTTTLATELFGSTGAGIAVGILTFVILIFAEVAPKQIALIHNEFIAAHTVVAIYLLSVILRPFVIFINVFGSLISRIFSKSKGKSISLEGILHIVNIAEDEGLVDNQENYMVKKVFKLNDVPVHAIMTHRKYVFSIDGAMTVAQAYEFVKDSTFSRFPVYQGDKENVTGVLMRKCLLEKYAEGQLDLTIESFMMEPVFIQEVKKIKHLFSLFKKNHMKMVVVLDEYGGLSGIVTQEDVVEEIFGELYDEQEQEKDQAIKLIGENQYEIRGETPIHEVEALLNIDLAEDSYMQTLAGFMIEKLAEIPVAGAVLIYKNFVFKVKTVEKNRIKLIFVTIHESDEDE
ncbi:MAG: HlyC/CorC family transporter [Spirochaetales bacterium]|nr:HlyC/CorC family transporter [Spirochaetales bacterium]